MTNRFAVLLRGINVGGRRMVPMATLRAVAERLGYSEVRTYVASGNLLLSANVGIEQLTSDLGKAIEAEFGFEVDLVVVTAAELRATLEGHPYSDGDEKQVCVTFLSEPLGPAARERLEALRADDERLEFGPVSARVMYADFAGGLARSKLAAAPLKGGVIGTTRNLRTVRKLVQLLTPQE